MGSSQPSSCLASSRFPNHPMTLVVACGTTKYVVGAIFGPQLVASFSCQSDDITAVVWGLWLQVDILRGY
jgi:hypothetical protein